MRTNTLLHFPLFLLVLCLPAVFSAQPVETPPSIFDLFFQDRTAVDMTLETDLQAILQAKPGKKEVDGVLSFVSNQGSSIRVDVKLETRGKFRYRACDFPPLRLDFSKKDLRNLGLAEFDDLKLVTHCLDQPESNDYVKREFFVYQLYQLLSPYHFRTQLVRITYLDTENPGQKTRAYSILIEDTAQVEARLGGTVLDAFGRTEMDLDSSFSCLHAFFQYMVGNTDWEIAAQRNLKLFQPAGQEKLIPIPYDFDFSGIVNAAYAIPNPNLNQTTIRQRFYLGSTDSPHLDQAAQAFVRKKELIFSFLKGFKLLKGSDRRDIRKYLAEGFEQLESRRFLESSAAE